MSRAFVDPRLLAVSPFAECSARERRLLAPVLTVSDVPAGAVLMREGEHGDRVLVVVDGAATVTRDGQFVAEVHRGDVVGELSVLVDGPRTATVVARSAMTIATFPADGFGDVLDTCPTVARAVLRTAIERLAPAA